MCIQPDVHRNRFASFLSFNLYPSLSLPLCMVHCKNCMNSKSNLSAECLCGVQKRPFAHAQYWNIYGERLAKTAIWKGEMLSIACSVMKHSWFNFTLKNFLRLICAVWTIRIFELTREDWYGRKSWYRITQRQTKTIFWRQVCILVQPMVVVVVTILYRANRVSPS